MSPRELREARLAWKLAVMAKRDGLSWISDLPAEISHHAVDQQQLRRRARDLGVDPEWLLWDPRVGVPLAEVEHRRHHNWRRRLTLAELPAEVFEFAEQFGLGYWLERHHSERAAA